VKAFEQKPNPHANFGCPKEEIDNFRRSLIDYIYCERQLESSKVNLMRKVDFNLLDVFKMFD
jgi:hypothetical protein